MSDPTIVVLDDNDARFDRPYIQDNLTSAAETVAKRVPAHYRHAVVDVPEIRDWVQQIIEYAAAESRGPCPIVGTGSSLLLLGITGTGKTHQAYGAIRAIAVSGARCSWELVTAADAYARLRPRHKVDAEQEFDRLAKVGLLVLDDLGAAKPSEWTEEVNYRLINHRYERDQPTLITSNVLPKDLGAAVGERVASRLTEMTTRVVLKGTDRRLGIRRAS